MGLTLTCLHTNRMIARAGREEEGSEESGDGRGNEVVLCYRVIIDFPNALQRRFSANIFRHNARRKGVDKLMIRDT